MLLRLFTSELLTSQETNPRWYSFLLTHHWYLFWYYIFSVGIILFSVSQAPVAPGALVLVTVSPSSPSSWSSCPWLSWSATGSPKRFSTRRSRWRKTRKRKRPKQVKKQTCLSRPTHTRRYSTHAAIPNNLSVANTLLPSTHTNR